jgi:hypothetical protein
MAARVKKWVISISNVNSGSPEPLILSGFLQAVYPRCVPDPDIKFHIAPVGVNLNGKV